MSKFKMLSFLALQIVFCLLPMAFAESGDVNSIVEEVPFNPDDAPKPDYTELKQKMDRIDELKLIEQKIAQHSIVEEPDYYFREMVQNVNDIIELLTHNPNNIMAFVEMQGVNKIIVPNLKKSHENLRMQLLILLEIVLSADTPAKIQMPLTVLDTLLDIFEFEHVLFKSRVCDVLNLWLPYHYKLQARLLKLDGLALFCDQVEHLDSNLLHSLIDLVSNIYKDHLKIMSKDNTDIKLKAQVEAIGFLKVFTRSSGCVSLFKVLKLGWFSRDTDEVLIPILEFINNTKSDCVTLFDQRTIKDVLTLLKSLVDYLDVVKEKKDNVVAVNINVDEYIQMLLDYIDKLEKILYNEKVEL